MDRARSASSASAAAPRGRSGRLGASDRARAMAAALHKKIFQNLQSIPSFPSPPGPSNTARPSAERRRTTQQMLSALASDAPSLARELFVPEVFTRDNLPEHLTNSELQRSISHLGDLERLHCFLEKIRAGRNVSVGVVGGSVSAGSSSMVRTDQGGLFHKKMQGWLQQRFPGARVTHFNAAMPAVPPDYMQHCVRLHVPQDADLIFLEAAANMCGPTDKHGVDQCQEGRASVERILRQLLRFPNAPAVVLVHAYPYWTMRTPKGWSQKGFRRKSLGKAGVPAWIPWRVWVLLGVG